MAAGLAGQPRGVPSRSRPGPVLEGALILLAALIDWLTNYGQAVLFFAQLVYWAVVCVAAIWAVLIFRQYVNGRASRRADESLETAAPTATPAEKPSIEEFVD